MTERHKNRLRALLTWQRMEFPNGVTYRKQELLTGDFGDVKVSRTRHGFQCDFEDGAGVLIGYSYAPVAGSGNMPDKVLSYLA